MKRHLKRQKAPKNWPIPRKGTAFVVKNNSKGLPILVAVDLRLLRIKVTKSVHT
jgi:ribosomal protein S4E